MYKKISCLVLFMIFASCSTTNNSKIDDYIFKRKNDKLQYIEAYNQSLKLWKVPFREDDVITSYGTAHVIISGPKEGEPLVLLHGMDASSTMWYPNIVTLAKTHRVYAIDFLMEPSKSVSSGGTISKEETIAWYEEIFKHYRLKKFKIIGASRGGWLATLLAIQEDSKVSKLVLLSPAQTIENIDQKNKASSALMLKIFPSKKKLIKTLDAFSFYPEKIDTLYKNQFYLANKYAKSNRSFLQMLPFSKEELESIKIPALIMIGDHDVINSEETLNRAEELFKNAEIIEIENAGHFLSIDQSKIVNKKVIDFLDK